jgi:hypothetical protein
VYGEQLVAINASERSITHIFSSAASPHSQLTVYTNCGSPDATVLDTAASHVLTLNDKIYAFSGNRMLVYSPEGKLKATYAMPYPVHRYVLAKEDNRVYLIFDDQVSCLKLP